MSLIAQQNFLARLFTDENLRRNFFYEPCKIGKENYLNEDDISQLREIIQENLNFFANSLYHKRLHEVEKLLPLTKSALGNDFAKLFQEFAKKFHPKSVKKHLEDAIEFCKFLQHQSIDPIFVRDTAKFEKTKHEFYSKNKFISICFLRFDVFTHQKKLKLSVWYRFGKQTNNLVVF